VTGALHEPQLLPYAIGRRQSDWKDVAFRQAEPDPTAPLREFEPPGVLPILSSPLGGFS
jgi:hypothetical protein